MSKTRGNSRFVALLVRGAVGTLLATLVAGCGAAVGSLGDEDPGLEGVAVGEGKVDAPGQKPSIGSDVVVDCTAARDEVSVRTCKLGTTDVCTVQATLLSTQVVKNSAVVKAVSGTSGTHNGKAVHLLDAAEAKLLANLHHMKLLSTPAGGLASTAYEYAKDGTPFVFAEPTEGGTRVTKASANASIARVTKALKAASATCTQFRVASTDGITPVDTAFICEKTASDTLLLCDGTQPEGLDYAVGPSTIVNGVELSFVKMGCGAFGYDLVNQGESSVSVQSKISGIALQPPCDFGLAAQGSGYCDAAGITGPVTLTYSGTVKRGSITKSFSLPVTVRCSGS